MADYLAGLDALQSEGCGKKVRFYSCSIYRSLKKEKKDNNPDFKTREDWMRTETQCIVLKKKKNNKTFFKFFWSSWGGEGSSGRRGEARTVSISQSQVFTEAR